MKGTAHWFEDCVRETDKYIKLGRPAFWTYERIEDMIKDLQEWAELPTSICMAGFRSTYYLNRAQLQVVREKSISFAYAYDQAQLKIAERLATNTGKSVHPAVFNKYQPYYDTGLGDHEIGLIKIKSKADAEGQALSLDQIKKLQCEGKLDKPKQ